MTVHIADNEKPCKSQSFFRNERKMVDRRLKNGESNDIIAEKGYNPNGWHGKMTRMISNCNSYSHITN